MTDYAYNRWIEINGGIYIEQDTMKSILELRFNPGEGIAYVQSAAKGLSLLCCRSRSNNETEEIKERELALNATEQTRQFEDYVKYVRERLRTSQQAIIGTSSRTLRHTCLFSGCSLEIGVTTSSTSINSCRDGPPQGKAALPEVLPRNMPQNLMGNHRRWSIFFQHSPHPTGL